MERNRLRPEVKLSVILGIEPFRATDFLSHGGQPSIDPRVVKSLGGEEQVRRLQRDSTALQQFLLDPNRLLPSQVENLPAVSPRRGAAILSGGPYFSLHEFVAVSGISAGIAEDLFAFPRFAMRDKVRERTISLEPIYGMYVGEMDGDWEAAVAQPAGFHVQGALRDPGTGKRLAIYRPSDFQMVGLSPHHLKQSLNGRVYPVIRDEQGFSRFLVPLGVDVWVRKGVDEERVRTIVAMSGLKIVDTGMSTKEVGYYRTRLVHWPTERDPLSAAIQAAAGVMEFEEIDFAELEEFGIRDFDLHNAHASNTIDFETVDRDWHLAQINFDTASAEAQGSPDVTVFTIDSGIDTEHPDLKPSLRADWRELDLNFDIGDPPEATSPDEKMVSHGTQVSGVVGCQGIGPIAGSAVKGIARNCRLLPIKIPGEATSLGYGLRAAAIRHAIGLVGPAGRGVINLSWRTSGEHIGIREALVEADRAGFAIVASAGNYNPGEPQFADQLHYPSGHRNQFPYLKSLCAVAATNRARRKASYSYFGKESVTLAAPGGEEGGNGMGLYTASTPEDYAYCAGTSFAAPIVAGVIALMFSLDANLSAKEAIQILCDTAKKPGSDAEPEASAVGKGIIDAGAALKVVQQRMPIRPPATGESPVSEPSTPGMPEGKLPVDLNRADEGALQNIPHLTPWHVQFILAFRENRGPFRTVWDLTLASSIAFPIWFVFLIKDYTTV